MENNDKDFLNDNATDESNDNPKVVEETVTLQSDEIDEETTILQNNQNSDYNASSIPIVTDKIEFKTLEKVKAGNNKGLKIFSLILAFLLLLSGSCLGGYFLGISSVQRSTSIELDLEAKPKDTDAYSPSQVYAMINKSVVGIVVYNVAGKTATASGVVYSEDGYIITNDHIYASIPAPQFRIYTFDGKEYDAKYVAGDTRSDLAVLKVDSNGFYPATFGNSDETVIGESVVAVGRPSTAQSESSITTGTVSLTQRRVSVTSSYSSKFIQTDAAINPGSSGGALINMYGQVIGITSSKASADEYERVGFAIPTTTVKRVVESLIKTGKVVDRARLGISYNLIDSITAKMNGLTTTGLLVRSVTEDSELYGKVTVNEDIIVQINGKDITDDSVVLDIIDSSKPGDVLTFTIQNKAAARRTVAAALLTDEGSSSYTTSAQSGSSSSSGDSGQENPDFSFPFGD